MAVREAEVRPAHVAQQRCAQLPKSASVTPADAAMNASVRGASR
ncbi:hypothetical protein [Microbacterium sp.]|nr:hypothetical protein [Microbacterium sp.]